MNIPQNHLAQIYANCIGQKVTCTAKAFQLPDKIIGGIRCNDHGEYPLYLTPIDSHKGDYYTNSEWSILKRPLSSITDEHLLLLLQKALFDLWGHECVFKSIEYLSEGDGSGIIAFTEDDERIGFTTWDQNGIQFRLSVDLTNDIYLNFNAMYYILNQLGYALDATLLDENNKPVTYSVETLVENGVYKLI